MSVDDAPATIRSTRWRSLFGRRSLLRWTLIAGVALVVLIGAVMFSKRKSGGFGEESEIVAEAMAEHGRPEGSSAGE